MSENEELVQDVADFFSTIPGDQAGFFSFLRGIGIDPDAEMEEEKKEEINVKLSWLLDERYIDVDATNSGRPLAIHALDRLNNLIKENE